MWRCPVVLLATLAAAPAAEAQIRPTFARRAAVENAVSPTTVAAILRRSDLALTAEQAARLRDIADGLGRVNAPLEEVVRRAPASRPPAEVIRPIRANNRAALARAYAILNAEQRALLEPDATRSGAPR